MDIRNQPPVSSWALLAVALATVIAVSGCSINVKKDERGQEKKVDIETPIGGIHVSKDVDVRATGIPVYPGARVKEKEAEGEEKSANVNISTGLFGLKVVAVEYESDDPPEKLIAYYKDQLKKYGSVIECHTNREHHVQVEGRKGDSKSHELKCDGDNGGKRVELKVGTEENQHLVSIEPRDKGSSFALVYVQTRGRETI